MNSTTGEAEDQPLEHKKTPSAARGALLALAKLCGRALHDAREATRRRGAMFVEKGHIAKSA